MLTDSIKSIIIDEQLRQNGQFIDIDLNEYLEKLNVKAEIVSDFLDGRCRGFVAYYCNDLQTRIAFITLVLVNPLDRGLGLGQTLTEFVLNTSRKRGFNKCRLEVKKANQVAYNLYLSLGFILIEERSESYLLEIQL